MGFLVLAAGFTFGDSLEGPVLERRSMEYAELLSTAHFLQRHFNLVLSDEYPYK